MITCTTTKTQTYNGECVELTNSKQNNKPTETFYTTMFLGLNTKSTIKQYSLYKKNNYDSS